MATTKQFKNRRGEMPWYVVALILAIIVLLVSLGAVWKIRQNQNGAEEQISNTCETVAGGKCETKTTGCTGGQTPLPGLCAKDFVCCKGEK